MANTQPTCFIIAGPNGAGKTTFAMKYLPAVGCLNFVNADKVAYGLSPLNESSALFAACKISLQEIDRYIALRQNFAFETTLSGKTYLPKIKAWRNAGWHVVLIYLHIPNTETSVLRVKSRVEQGGHDVPIDSLTRRYPRSLMNLFEYMKHCDSVHCLDNSANIGASIFDGDKSGIEVYNSSIFSQIKTWAYPATKTGNITDMAVNVLQKAVNEELIKKAKLGQTAVTCINGKPREVSAKYLVRKMRKESIIKD